MDGELFPGVTLDDLAAEAFPSPLQPVAGGAPGVASDFSLAFEWAAGSAFGELADFISGKVNFYTGKAAEGIVGVLSITMWWIYRFTRGALAWLIPDYILPIFPDPQLITGLTPWYYWHKTTELIGRVIHHQGAAFADVVWLRVLDARDFMEGVVIEWADWTAGKITDAKEDVFDFVGNSSQWLAAIVFSWADWTVGQVDLIAQWLWGKMIDVGTGTIDWITSGVNFLDGKIATARDLVIAAFTDLPGSLFGAVIDARDWVVGKVEEWADWLWGQITGAFNAVTSAVIGAVVSGGQLIGEAIQDAFEWLVNVAAAPLLDVLKVKLAIPGKLIRAEYGSLDELLNDMLDPPDEVLTGFTGLMMFPFIVVGLLVNLITGMSGPLLEPALQEQRRNVGARVPPFQMLRDGFLRGEMDVATHDDWLGRTGFEPSLIELVKSLYNQIPGQSDLVRMGVREVFTPEIAEAFGQFEDFPPEFGEFMEKIGFTEEWALRFWGAHWDLPGVRDAFEMFHRGVIAEEELALLLRALDIMPFWRDKLTEIAFQRITRVDLRRMYKAGSIPIERVEKGYRDLGYSPEDAILITNWVRDNFAPTGSADDAKLRDTTVTTIRKAYAFRLILRAEAVDRLQDLRYTAEAAELTVAVWDFDFARNPSLRSDVDSKGLARGVIEDTYRRRLVDFNAAVAELAEQGYTPEDANLLLARVDLTLAEELADLEIRIVLDELESGAITLAGMAGRLADLNVPPARIEFLVERETLRREAKNRRLTLSQLKRAVAQGIVPLEDWFNRLDAMGYNQRDVNVLTALNADQFGLA